MKLGTTEMIQGFLSSLDTAVLDFHSHIYQVEMITVVLQKHAKEEYIEKSFSGCVPMWKMLLYVEQIAFT